MVYFSIFIKHKTKLYEPYVTVTFTVLYWKEVEIENLSKYFKSVQNMFELLLYQTIITFTG